MRNYLKFKRFGLLLIVSTLSLLTSCKKEMKESNFEISDKTIIVDATNADNLISSDNTSLTFNGNTTGVTSWEPGSIVVIEKGEGFLRKIKSVEKIGGNIKLNTENASIEDVVTKGEFDFEATLSPDNLVGFKCSDENISLVKGIGEFSLRFDNIKIGTSGVRINGSTKFDPPKIRLKPVFSSGKLDSVSVSIEISSTTSYEMIADITAYGIATYAPPFCQFTFASFTAFIGPLPVIITPKLGLVLGADFSINGKAQAGIDISTNVKGGIIYQDYAIKPYSSINQTITNSYVSTATKGTIEGFVLLPKLDLFLYSLAGPFVNLKFYGALRDKSSISVGFFAGYKAECGFETNNNVLSYFKLPNGSKIPEAQLKLQFPIKEWELLTISGSSKPAVNTNPVTSKTSTSAVVGGNVTADGEAQVTERGVFWGDSQNPEITGNKLKIGEGTGIYSSTISGLIPNKLYYVKAYAINTQGISFGEQVSFETLPNYQASTVTDIDGNVYSTVTIGNQTWMKENLKVTHLNDNAPIQLVTSNSFWASMATSAYCWYNNGEAANKNIYGGLYNWYAVNTGKLCPSGWHVPTDTEWATLRDFLGGPDVAGGKIKESGYTHWRSPNVGATNESGFTGLPAGHRYNNGTFSFLTYNGYGWSSKEYNTNNAIYIDYRYDNDNMGTSNFPKTTGFSVRCLKN